MAVAQQRNSAKAPLRVILKPWLLLLLLLLLLIPPAGASAADDPQEFLPPVSCAAGWHMEGKPSLYDKETLSDRIDGEAELYFPYRFDRMAAARYVSAQVPGAGMDVEIYRLGSLLDAFGMFANYRQKDGDALEVGAEGNGSPSQLFFYQGRNFVHIQVTGTEVASQEVMARCARAVASHIPAKPQRPAELSVFDRPEVVKGSERYLPESLLGYDFLNQGLLADAVVAGGGLQVFSLQHATRDSAKTAFDRYRAQLAPGSKTSSGDSGTLLEGVDLLYGPVIILRKEACLVGALKFSGGKGVRPFLESLCK
jgi:hypothetical protein